MNTPSNTRVVFFQVNDNHSKLKIIVETAQTHFKKKEPFLIIVEDDMALKFVDDLLWKLPSSSFLPHSIAESETSELITLTKCKKNLKFEDLTAPIKKNLSSLRYDAYKGAGFLIEAR